MGATNVPNQFFNKKIHEAQGGNESIAESGGFSTWLSGAIATFQAGAQCVMNPTAGTWLRTGQERIFNTHAKIGGSAGAAVNEADDLAYLATVPASQTAATIVVPLPGLKVGDIITAFKVNGQVESLGNAVTVDADLRKHTAAAAEPADVSVGTITQVSESADAIVAAAKSALTEVVATDETFYVLLTVTTLSDTDFVLLSIGLTVTEK